MVVVFVGWNVEEDAVSLPETLPYMCTEEGSSISGRRNSRNRLPDAVSLSRTPPKHAAHGGDMVATCGCGRRSLQGDFPGIQESRVDSANS